MRVQPVEHHADVRRLYPCFFRKLLIRHVLVEFADDIFGLKPGWIEQFAGLVNAQGAPLPFKCLLRADLLTDATVDALQRAGCRTVWMGAESGSQKILDAMEKGTRVEQIYAAAARLHHAGIAVGFFLQFGYRGEARSDIEQTLQMVRDCAPDDIGISVSYPLPGTKFYERVKAELGEKKNWVDSDDLAMMYRGAFSSAFYRKLHAVVHKEFRARKAWRALRLGGHRANAFGKLALNLATLPIARGQLELLARASREPAHSLAATLSPDAAAQPTARMD